MTDNTPRPALDIGTVLITKAGTDNGVQVAPPNTLLTIVGKGSWNDADWWEVQLGTGDTVWVLDDGTLLKNCVILQ